MSLRNLMSGVVAMAAVILAVAQTCTYTDEVRVRFHYGLPKTRQHSASTPQQQRQWRWRQQQRRRRRRQQQRRRRRRQHMHMQLLLDESTGHSFHPSSPRTQASCFSNQCTWCVCAAVPSSCLTYEAAQKLPHSIFNCGNSTRTDCGVATTNATCMLDVGCAWCDSKAVKPRCVNVMVSRHRGGCAGRVVRGRKHRSSPSPLATRPQNATALPPSVFSCTWSDGKQH
jgi:hypothetical protein